MEIPEQNTKEEQNSIPMRLEEDKLQTAAENQTTNAAKKWESFDLTGNNGTGRRSHWKFRENVLIPELRRR